jgi:hypothetical protein
MEKRLKSASIDTFGYLEALVADPQALSEFYTFAAFGRLTPHDRCNDARIEAQVCDDTSTPSSRTQPWHHTKSASGCTYKAISPYMTDYKTLNPLFNNKVRMLLISQQKLEAFFKDYRHGVSKQANDDLKEAVFMIKQNVYKRSKAEEDAGLHGVLGPTCIKQDALDRLKQKREMAAAHAEAQVNIIADMAPHIGHGRSELIVLFIVLEIMILAECVMLQISEGSSTCCSQG